MGWRKALCGSVKHTLVLVFVAEQIYRIVGRNRTVEKLLKFILDGKVPSRPYNNSMKLDARPQQEILKDLEALCQKEGFIHVLAALVFENNFHSVRVEEKFPRIQDQFNDKKLIRNELSVLHGLVLKGGVDFPPLSFEEINETKEECYSLLEELHKSFYSKAIRDGSFLTKKDGLMSHPDIIREAVFYAADSAFYFQQYSFSVERYSSDNEWLSQTVGFTIEEAARITGAIIANTRIQAQALMAGFFGDDVSVHCHEVFSISVEDLCTMTGYTNDKVRNFLKQFSVTTEPTNEQYNSVDSYNLAKSHPIIMLDDDKLCLLQSHSLCESLYVSPTFWMHQDSTYRPSASQNRGRHLEEKITSRLIRVFGEERVFQNVEMYRGKKRIGEIDVLVAYSDRAIVVQAKTKTLTLKAQQGDQAVLEDDFGKAIQSGYNQAYSCSTELLKGGVTLKKETGEVLHLATDYIEIFPLCIVADHYPSLYFQARQFLRTRTHKKIRPPYVMDLFLLDVMTEFLTHPVRMLDYLNKRTQYNESVFANNDFAVLGYHLAHNLYKDPEYNMMMLDDDIAYEVDKAFAARREHGDLDAIPKGVLTEFEGTPYGDILNHLDGLTEKGAVELGYHLLSLDGTSINGINKGIRQLSKSAKKSGRTHDFTMGGPHGGITYHVSTVPSEERVEHLLSHAEVRKYSTKANKWFGLSATIGNGKPIDTICFLSHRWKPNAMLDAKLSKIPTKPSKLSSIAGRLTDKLGVNDKCHCGSNKKYKKCCLRSDQERSL